MSRWVGSHIVTSLDTEFILVSLLPTVMYGTRRWMWIYIMTPRTSINEWDRVITNGDSLLVSGCRMYMKTTIHAHGLLPSVLQQRVSAGSAQDFQAYFFWTTIATCCFDFRVCNLRGLQLGQHISRIHRVSDLGSCFVQNVSVPNYDRYCDSVFNSPVAIL